MIVPCMQGGLKHVVRQLRAFTPLPAVAAPCARILAAAAGTSAVTASALAKEKVRPRPKHCSVCACVWHGAVRHGRACRQP
jgi:hypothetical protein